MTDDLNPTQQREKILGLQIPASSLSFDAEQFKGYLADSIVLSFEDKLLMVSSIPSMSQEQIDGLIELLKQEHDQYVALDAKQVEKMKKMREDFQQKQKGLSDEIDRQLTSDEEKLIIEELKSDLSKETNPSS